MRGLSGRAGRGAQRGTRGRGGASKEGPRCGAIRRIEGRAKCGKLRSKLRFNLLEHERIKLFEMPGIELDEHKSI